MAVVLIVDDEEDIRELVGIYLKNEGMKVCKAAITLCMEIRKKSNIPIIMLSAKDQDMDKVIGLTAGADDYLAKPFNPIELVARVKAQLRRSNDFNRSKSSNRIYGFIYEFGNASCIFKWERGIAYAKRICNFRAALEK